MAHGALRRVGSGIGESSKRRNVSRRGGTRTRRRAAGYATQAEDAKSDDKGKRGVGEGGAAVLILLSTSAEMKWLIVWQGAGSTNKRNLSCYSPRILVILFVFC